MAINVSCPHCGGKRMAHLARTIVAYEVAMYDRDARGDLSGSEYVGPEMVDWESSEEVDHPWKCLTCSREMAEADLVVVENDEPAARPASLWITRLAH